MRKGDLRAPTLSEIVALPCINGGGATFGLSVSWQDDNTVPMAGEGVAKTPNIAAQSILGRAVAWAKCWGPSAWYFRGISWPPVLIGNGWGGNTWTANMGELTDGVQARMSLWAGTAAPDSFFAAGDQPAVNDSTGGPSRTRLPRSWFLTAPSEQGVNRPYVVYLELASLGTNIGAPTSLEFPA